MAVESGTYISDLDTTRPSGGDAIAEGDNHIVLIKNILKNTFPGVGGDGFAIEITATEEEINHLSGVSANIATTLSSLNGDVANLKATLSAPAGTRMVFHQAAAPTGWTQVTTYSNHMLRVISTAGGGNGGSDSPILNNKVPSHTHGLTSAATTVNGYHSHSQNYASVISTNVFQAQLEFGNDWASGVVSQSINGNGNHSHSLTGSTDANASASNWTPQYIDMIICQKNA